MKNNNIFLLIIGAVLLGYGIFSPVIKNNVINDNVTITVVAPLDPSLRDSCEKVVETFKNGTGNKKTDGTKLSSLYSDLAKLIALDGENETIKNTDEIRDANRLAGLLYDLGLKDNYPGLANAANSVIVNHIGDDNVVLDQELRTKAVEAFNGLSWAFYEGSK